MGVWAGCRRAGRAARSTAAMTKSPRGGRLACRGAFGTGRGAFWQHGLRPGARFAPAGPQPAGGNGRGAVCRGWHGGLPGRASIFISVYEQARSACPAQLCGGHLSFGRAGVCRALRGRSFRSG